MPQSVPAFVLLVEVLRQFYARLLVCHSHFAPRAQVASDFPSVQPVCELSGSLRHIKPIQRTAVSRRFRFLWHSESPVVLAVADLARWAYPIRTWLCRCCILRSTFFVRLDRWCRSSGLVHRWPRSIDLPTGFVSRTSRTSFCTSGSLRFVFPSPNLSLERTGLRPAAQFPVRPHPCTPQ